MMSNKNKINDGIELVKKLTKYDDSTKTFKRNYDVRFTYPTITRSADRASFNNGIEGVLGVYTRLICGNKATYQLNAIHKNYDGESQVIEEIVGDVVSKITCSSDDLSKCLRQLLINYIFTVDNKTNIFSIPCYKYSQLNSNNSEQKGELKFGKFLYSCLGNVKNTIEDENRADDVGGLVGELTKPIDELKLNFFEKLILKAMEKSLDSETTQERMGGKHIEDEIPIIDWLPAIRKNYLRDVRNLLRNEQLFIDKFPMLFAYYAHFYLTQTALRLDEFFENDKIVLEECENNSGDLGVKKVYYLFDNEALYAARKAKDNGYFHVSNVLRRTMNALVTTAQLNAIFNTQNHLPEDLLKKYDEADDEMKSMYMDALNEWIRLVLENPKMSSQPVPEFDSSQALKTKFQYLYVLNKIIGGKETSSRSTLSINSLSALYFIQSHGRNGNSYHLSQEFLLLLLNICKNGDNLSKIPLKDFYRQLENRGICFDSDSKRNIEIRLAELSLLDKKSDSGDAAYV